MADVITIVNGSDWIGIYIDGQLVYENHDIEPERLLDLVNVTYESCQVDYDWLCKRGTLPKDALELKLTK